MKVSEIIVQGQGVQAAGNADIKGARDLINDALKAFDKFVFMVQDATLKLGKAEHLWGETKYAPQVKAFLSGSSIAKDHKGMMAVKKATQDFANKLLPAVLKETSKMRAPEP
jgi:hypothetical protein